MSREYANAGVDYSKIEPFKRAMVHLGKRTLYFPNARNVYINEEALGAHGVIFEYRGPHHYPIWCTTTEGLGNKIGLASGCIKIPGQEEPTMKASALIR